MATSNYLFCEFLNSVSKGTFLTCIYMCKHEGNAVNMKVRRKLTFKKYLYSDTYPIMSRYFVISLHVT